MMANTGLFIRPPPQAERLAPLMHRLLSRTMSRTRLAPVLLGAGLLGSQAGHLLAYELRFGGAAMQLQSAGAHSYFPAVAKTGLGVTSLALLAGFLVVGMARVLARRPIYGAPAPSFIRLLAGLYTLQLGLFAAQETLEAMLGGGHVGSAPLLLLWGAIGQLPVAVAATLAVRWLVVQVRPAMEALRLPAVPAHQFLVLPIVVSAWPLTARQAVRVEVFDNSYVRGPPSF